MRAWILLIVLTLFGCEMPKPAATPTLAPAAAVPVDAPPTPDAPVALDAGISTPATYQCPRMPACGIGCPGAMAHDEHGCTLCACEPDPLDKLRP